MRGWGGESRERRRGEGGKGERGRKHDEWGGEGGCKIGRGEEGWGGR